jgi:hypothetical protein
MVGGIAALVVRQYLGENRKYERRQTESFIGHSLTLGASAYYFMVWLVWVQFRINLAHGATILMSTVHIVTSISQLRPAACATMIVLVQI